MSNKFYQKTSIRILDEIRSDIKQAVQHKAHMTQQLQQTLVRWQENNEISSVQRRDLLQKKAQSQALESIFQSKTLILKLLTDGPSRRSSLAYIAKLEGKHEEDMAIREERI